MISQLLSLFDLVNALACHVISLLLKTYSAELVSQSNFGVEKIFEKKGGPQRVSNPYFEQAKSSRPRGPLPNPSWYTLTLSRCRGQSSGFIGVFGTLTLGYYHCAIVPALNPITNN